MPDKLTITDTLPISWLSPETYKKAYRLLARHTNARPMYFAASSSEFYVITSSGLEKNKYLSHHHITQCVST
jgi:hypothetical protein